MNLFGKKKGIEPMPIEKLAELPTESKEELSADEQSEMKTLVKARQREKDRIACNAEISASLEKYRFALSISHAINLVDIPDA